jgi:hypothetical protein
MEGILSFFSVLFNDTLSTSDNAVPNLRAINDELGKIWKKSFVANFSLPAEIEEDHEKSKGIQCSRFNTLRTGDADLRLYITTVQDR